ncbi:MAG: radical SAM protein [Deltaproteobacteria bacterium]|nr:radical SAM protein [Deltaproteobacteria bacterium]
MNALIFPAPEADRAKPRIQPVFMPFQGCPTRCVFCAQALQTGERPRGVRDVLADLAAGLERAADEGEGPRELAFYGGTFTALPPADQFACLDLAARYRAKGLVTRVRASTRPDALSPAHLQALREAGLVMLELGVQSFCDTPLAVSRRGYTGEAARRACAMVRESGLALGIQLMPGMPGMLEEDFLRDIDETVGLDPAAVRLYPCLVLAGTALAAMFERGEFVPWPLEAAIPLLANALRAFWRADIPVIRIGLAPQDGLDHGGILAGPRHPALGDVVRSHALFGLLSEKASRLGRPVEYLGLPRRFQGAFWGHKGGLKKAYAALGITPDTVTWHDADVCEMR